MKLVPALAALVVGLGLVSAQAQAQAPAPAAGAREGTLLLMTGSAEVEVANDEAVASFFFEVQDADPVKAQAQINQRVAEGIAALKAADPKGMVQSSGYSSYPVYASGPIAQANRKIVGWRVRQGVTLRTSNLADLSKTVAAAQQTLALGGIEFRLSKGARERLDAQLIQMAISNLNARFAAAAQALNVPQARVRLEEVNFGVREQQPVYPMAMRAAAAPMADSMPEPVLEPGRSTERLGVTGKARLLPQ